MSLPTKPLTASYNALDPLGTSPGIIAGLLAGTGVPTDDATAVAGAYTTANGGTTTPAWSVDGAGNAVLQFLGGASSLGTDKELHFSGKGITANTIGTGITLHAIIAPATTSVLGCVVAARSNDCGLLIYGGGSPVLGLVLGLSPLSLTSYPALNYTDTWGLVVTLANVSSNIVVKAYAYNYTTGTQSTVSTTTITGQQLSAYIDNASSDAVVNMRYGAATWAARGNLYEAGYAKEAWDQTKVSAYWVDPWEAVRSAGLVPGTLTLTSVGTTTLGFSLSTPIDGTAPYGPLKWYRSTTSGFTPGAGNLQSTVASPTFPATLSLTGVPANTPEYVIATVTDSSVSPLTITSPQVAGVCYPIKRRGYLKIGQSHTGYIPAIASKITDGTTDLYPAFIEVQASESGSYVADWLPNAAIGGSGVPTSKNRYRYWLDAAIAAWSGQALDEAIIRFEFGINDASLGTSAATVVAGLNMMIAAIQADSALAALNIPSLRFAVLSPIACAPNLPNPERTPAALGLEQQYAVAFKAMDNSGTIRYLGDDIFDWTMNHATSDYFAAGGTHLTQSPTGAATQSGYAIVSQLEAVGFQRVMLGVGLPSAGGGSVFSPLGSSIIRGN